MIQTTASRRAVTDIVESGRRIAQTTSRASNADQRTPQDGIYWQDSDHDCTQDERWDCYRGPNGEFHRPGTPESLNEGATAALPVCVLIRKFVEHQQVDREEKRQDGNGNGGNREGVALNERRPRNWKRTEAESRAHRSDAIFRQVIGVGKGNNATHHDERQERGPDEPEEPDPDHSPEPRR